MGLRMDFVTPKSLGKEDLRKELRVRHVPLGTETLPD